MLATARRLSSEHPGFVIVLGLAALTGIGVGILVGSAATSGYVFRYFIPTILLVLCAGLLAIPAVRPAADRVD